MEIEKKGKEIRVKPRDYQPCKAELEEKIHIPTTPEELARAVLQQVDVVEMTDS
ncbi:MAG: hypothetical protein OXC57_05585 [Rhodobacteraceae bacterium]|nr:hypothetical protein [Paracoccaceae bacterium]